MTPYEKASAIRKIKNLEIDIACAQQELQFSQHKDQIRTYIKNKEAKMETIKNSIENKE
jgi:hypothetical protein